MSRFICAAELLFGDRTCVSQCAYCANQETTGQALRERTTVTLTTGTTGFAEGDVVRFSDVRPWWKRVWDWICRRPPPNLYARVTSVVGDTITIEEVRDER